MQKTTHPLLQKYLILPTALLFGLSLLISLSGMEVFSSLILLIVPFHIRRSEIKLKNFYRPDFLALSALVFFCLLSLIINGYTEDLFTYFFKFRWILFLYFFGLFFKLSTKALSYFFTGLLAGLFISFLNSIFQFITNWDIIRQKLINPNIGLSGYARVTSFFNLPTTYGYCLAMVLIVPLVYLFLKEPKKNKILMSLIFLSGLASLILTYTRGAWISFFCAFFCFIWLANKKFILWMTPLALLTGLLLFYFQPGFQQRITSLLDLKYTSNSERIELWKANWKIFKDHPLFGVGLHKNDKLVEDYNKILNHKHNAVSHAHNTYLQFLAGTGLTGFISLMIFFVFLLKQMIFGIYNSKNTKSLITTKLYENPGSKLFPKDTESKFYEHILRAGFLSILLSFLVGCLFDCNLRDAEVRYMLISLLAVFFFLSEDIRFFESLNHG